MSSQWSATRSIVLSSVLALGSGLGLAALLAACDDPPAPATEPTATTAAPAAESGSAPATATAEGPPAAKPTHPCPDGSTGEGTLKAPCDAKGTARLMEVTWTGKRGDEGPSFRVINKAKLEILYGNLAVYFYDKAGKQLEVPAAEGGKPHPKKMCSGNIFGGPMKAGEKVVLTFSCVGKEHVPEGTAAIEGEMQTVGFTGASGAKADTYWRNNDIAPDARPKGGAK